MEILNISDALQYMKTDTRPIFVSGVTGQDGSYMVDYLLENTNYTIFGGARRLSVENHKNLNHLKQTDRFKLINFDLSDAHSISKIVETLKPAYFINFAAQTFVGSSWDFPAQTWECNTTAIIHILEAIKKHAPDCKLYQSGSSEQFGNVEYCPQDEKHPLNPRSPYGASKCASKQIIKVYRESYNLFAIQGTLFNHESERRGFEFVTRKITRGVSEIINNLKNNTPVSPIELGNINAKRDWSHSKDFIVGIWLMLNQKTPIEYVLSSDETHSIKEFVELAFKVGFEHSKCDFIGRWEPDEYTGFEKYVIYNDVGNSHTVVTVNKKFYRPSEVDLLVGNSTRARKELGWSPKINFKTLVNLMVKNDIDNLDRK